MTMTSAPPFTSHNIRLRDGSHTRPGAQLLAKTGICQAALRDLEMAFPLGPAGVTIADLGCLEGGYAAAFAAAGYATHGVEARADNFACCQHVALNAGLANLTFAQGDVRDLVDRGLWDAVFCCGLLYHLDEPVAFLRKLGRATHRLLILQTHYARDWPYVSADYNEGFRGEWHAEPPGHRWGAHGNRRSFWLCRRDLLAAMRDAGFSLVFEQADFLTDMREGSYLDQHGQVHEQRGMFVGLKTRLLDAAAPGLLPPVGRRGVV
jgi:SAM-dependent methyltransferase